MDTDRYGDGRPVHCQDVNVRQLTYQRVRFCNIFQPVRFSNPLWAVRTRGTAATAS